MTERRRGAVWGCVKCFFHEYQMCDLGRRGTVMEANYFWQSWLSVCFHGKVHSQRHERSPTASDCSPLNPSLVKCYFEIGMWDLCFDSRASNVTLCWSLQENLKPFRITTAEIVYQSVKHQYNLQSDSGLCNSLISGTRCKFHSGVFEEHVRHSPNCSFQTCI